VVSLASAQTEAKRILAERALGKRRPTYPQHTLLICAIELTHRRLVFCHKQLNPTLVEV
jgi:hypothetical protein